MGDRRFRVRLGGGIRVTGKWSLRRLSAETDTLSNRVTAHTVTRLPLATGDCCGEVVGDFLRQKLPNAVHSPYGEGPHGEWNTAAGDL